MMRRIVLFTVLTALLCTSVCTAAEKQGAAQSSPQNVETWRLAVQAGDANALKAQYVTSPTAAQIQTTDDKKIELDQEVAFWAGWKKQGLTSVRLEIAKEDSPKINVHAVTMRVTLTLKANGAEKKLYVATQQIWMQESTTSTWRIAGERRTGVAGLPQPMVNKDVYPSGADAKAEIAEAVKKAGATHKRVLVVFGGNWCYDCHVLDEAFQSAEIAPTIKKGFEVVHVDIGEMNKNLDVAKQYDIPLDKGVPAIAVLESDGKLLFSQKRGEFEAARSMATEDVLEFLKKWKAGQ